MPLLLPPFQDSLHLSRVQKEAIGIHVEYFYKPAHIGDDEADKKMGTEVITSSVEQDKPFNSITDHEEESFEYEFRITPCRKSLNNSKTTNAFVHHTYTCNGVQFWTYL